MSHPRSFATASPLLLLLLLAACAALCRGAPMAGELRCRCVQTVSEVIHPKRIAYAELIPEGPHCGVAEVIATTKHGKKVCLEPTAPWVKLIINNILNSKLKKL
ncbi:growth-regulated alpha protein-like [Emydura macquarii macquarii]|uniref:growth-regulated alpha protein-like n=1 Tax=Emydura macquarii macquarii TaxID=1129001 RepID=UPI00352A3C6B